MRKIEAFRANRIQQKRLDYLAEAYAAGNKSALLRELIDNAQEREGRIESYVEPTTNGDEN